MKKKIKNVCVFSSSSSNLESKYYQEARELGILLGKAGLTLVYGGGAVGTMYENAKAVKEARGKVIGVIPEKIHKNRVSNNDCDELHITACLRSRKEKMESLSDAVITLAGCFGTIAELTEMIVQNNYGYTDKPIVIINTDGFYDDLIRFFDKLIEKKFVSEDIKKIYFIANSPKEAVDYLLNL